MKTNVINRICQNVREGAQYLDISKASLYGLLHSRVGFYRFQNHLLIPYVVGSTQEIDRRIDKLEKALEEAKAARLGGIV